MYYVCFLFSVLFVITTHAKAGEWTRVYYDRMEIFLINPYHPDYAPVSAYVFRVWLWRILFALACALMLGILALIVRSL